MHDGQEGWWWGLLGTHGMGCVVAITVPGADARWHGWWGGTDLARAGYRPCGGMWCVLARTVPYGRHGLVCVRYASGIRQVCVRYASGIRQVCVRYTSGMRGPNIGPLTLPPV